MYWTKIEGSLYCGQRVQVNIMGLGTGSKSTECTFCTDCSYRGVRVMVFNATLNNISVISWRWLIL